MECNLKDIYELVCEVKEKFPDKTIWLYTGYTLEELIENIYTSNFDTDILRESYEKIKVVEKKSQRYITVDAVKSEKMQIKAKRDRDFAGEEIIGTFIDKLK